MPRGSRRVAEEEAEAERTEVYIHQDEWYETFSNEGSFKRFMTTIVIRDFVGRKLNLVVW